MSLIMNLKVSQLITKTTAFTSEDFSIIALVDKAIAYRSVFPLVSIRPGQSQYVREFFHLQISQDALYEIPYHDQ